jgi:predicted PurR-regulated permease PerM
VGRIAQFLLFLIVTFYLSVDAPNIGAKLAAIIPNRYRAEILEVGKQMDHVLSQYLRAQLILIALMSVASFIVLSLMGVRFALILAPIVGVLEIFPVIGPFAAITGVTLIALLSPPNYGLSHTGSALIVALAFFILRQVEDYAVIPNVIGHAVRLHPVLILFAVTAGATIGGALGLFLAVPITGALRVLAIYLYRKMDF